MTFLAYAPFPVTSTGRVVSAVPVGRLLPHEEHDGRRALRLARHVRRLGVWTAPLVIERDSLMVMDGHHRFRAAQSLGLSVLPAVLLSYEDAGVLLQAWRKGETWSSAIMLSRARSGLLLPRKTTRHLFQPAIGSVAIPLGWLAARRGAETAGSGLRPSVSAEKADLDQARPGSSSAGPSSPDRLADPAASYAQTRQRPETFGAPSLEQVDSSGEP